MPLTQFDENMILAGKTIYPLPYVAERFKPRGNFIPLGIKVFDDVMDGGLRGGEMVIISGQTGQGKTLYAQTLTAQYEAQRVSTLWFTYEMSPFYLNQKFVNMGVQKDWIDTHIYAPIELPSGKLDFVETEIKEAITEYDCKIIFIDHLHYLIPLDVQSNTSLFVGSIVRGLKQLAIKYDITICLIAHTKKIYQDEELNLSSIRDSSLIAQEADYVFLVERMKEDKKENKAMYEDGQKHSTGTEWLNTTKVHIAKNRRTGKLIYQIFSYENGILKLQ
jgi:replicative DNA helicase